MLENITDIPPQYSWENVDKSGPVNHPPLILTIVQ